MARRLSIILGVLAASSALGGCDNDAPYIPPGTTTISTGGGGAGGAGAGGAGGSTGGTAGADGCGDGVVCNDGKTCLEACDDGNTDGGDGCDPGCLVETGYACSGEPSACAPVCGDGLLAGAEACDDGNTDGGDGCDGACTVEDGYTCKGAPSDCATTCGDGVTAGDEACDDGDADPADGCDDQCLVEHGYECTGAPSACMTTCGDGIPAGAEECDDGGTAPGDGCDDQCLVEDGYTCIGEPSACATGCGDGVPAGAEECDDGGTAPGDGCDDQCLTETGYQCTGAPSACVTTCGDGIPAGDEQCDDGAAAPGDGCDDQCLTEIGYVCSGAPSACDSVCGDGIIAGGEMCDDGGTTPGDGCSAACDIEPGNICTGQPSICDPVCGDGVILSPEQCDDGGATPGDGCDAACQIEVGYACTGAPSACDPVCGDGIVTGAEACDDGGLAGGDGCDAGCAAEPGYTCSGDPSVCLTICGDGIQAGTEQCDDGNTADGDGCTALCTPATGETCQNPLVMSQAVQAGSAYTWTVPSGSVVSASGELACDPNGVGPDVVVRYTKTTDTLANGGMILHVKADTPSSTLTAYYLDLEVKGGACEAGAGASLKCDWYKDNWDAYIDGPPGDYWIWVAKNSAATPSNPFPEVVITAEEVPPSAGEGEGCFAPYTTSSAAYTPPGGAGQPHTWTIADGAINSFDMGPAWGEPGSISCDNTSGYGDIHGVDAVVKFDKQSAASVLKIDVQNLDPTLSQSDLNVEVMSVCDPTSPSKVSRNCRANKDAISITAPSPAGQAYVWVSTEATSEELNGASVQITEIFPGPGESWPTAVPLAGSGPITVTSAQRLDAPTCLPAGVNVHWFSYTVVNDVLNLAANVAGAVGIYDAGGQERACVADASASPIAFPAAAGETYYIAVASPTAITSFTIQDIVYNGVQGNATDMMITFPSSPTSEYGMVVDAGQIMMGDTSHVFAFPKTLGAAAVEYGAAEGLGTANLGYDLVLAGGSVFSVDNTTTTNVSRLFRVRDAATWGPPVAWDLTPAYPASAPSHAVATDGTDLFLATRKSTANTDVSFYSFSPAAPSVPALLGTTAGIWYAVGMAADTTYFYVAANGTAGEGIYRVLRSNIAAPAVKIAPIDTSTLCTNMELDSLASPQHLYVRDSTGDVHAIINPAGPAPVHAGAISTLGTSSDYAMTYDPATSSIYLFETETDSAGRIVRLQ